MKALLVNNVQNGYFNIKETDDSTIRIIKRENNKVIPVINKLLSKFELIIFTKETIPNLDDKISQDLSNELELKNIKGSFYIFKKKPEYNNRNNTSGFFCDGLAEFLKEKGVEDLYIVGLDTYWSINNTAVDSHHLGFKTIIINDGCTFSWDMNEEVLVNCNDLRINIIDSWEFPIYETIKNL